MRKGEEEEQDGQNNFITPNRQPNGEKGTEVIFEILLPNHTERYLMICLLFDISHLYN